MPNEKRQRTRTVSLESVNVQGYVDARHLAHMVNEFRKQGVYAPLKSMSALIRAITEACCIMTGGCSVETLDEALEILNTVDLAPDRTTRSKYRRIDRENYIQEARENGAYDSGKIVKEPSQIKTMQQAQIEQAALLAVQEAKNKGLLK